MVTRGLLAVTTDVQRCARTLTWLTEYHRKLELSPSAPLVQPVFRQISPEDGKLAVNGQRTTATPAARTQDWSRLELAAKEGTKDECLSSALAHVKLQQLGLVNTATGPVAHPNQ